MINISITIDVKNPGEVAANHGIPGFVPQDLIRGKVESEIKSTIIKKLKVALADELRRNGVKCNMNIS
ncbi:MULTISPECIES: hypothetical protein [Clostridium]|jgi:hypothetical protein|uniref:Uncharacterized protein n=3 Tax=Clostridium intestinale TaxID=36845 RepID=U2PYR4_9CLOT|nr:MULTISPECIES: hypothetical protein [Clostridium]ERK31620.1 hypothetical protein CINTURNW_0815 [Clostridium intestinale URNW]QLY78811.1 hypothetical protein HZF06_17220 [Clostridium intestinale]WRY53900.1 hypothetical protein P8F83_11960 [Clostridium intestinale]SHI04035.1 hypothetical protein SAMN02745941_01681 [Clostridium intestinale DSM 6191]